MSEKHLKVTDKRMFTAEGELRDEFRTLIEEERKAATEKPVAPAKPAASEPSAAPAAPARDSAAPKPKSYPSGAIFEDLVGLLAQSASVYLQQAAHPQARAEHLEMAKMHVDLLAILKDKTEGNLTPAEKALLDDAVYQLRMAVVQRG